MFFKMPKILIAHYQAYPWFPYSGKFYECRNFSRRTRISPLMMISTRINVISVRISLSLNDGIRSMTQRVKRKLEETYGAIQSRQVQLGRLPSSNAVGRTKTDHSPGFVCLMMGQRYRKSFQRIWSILDHQRSGISRSKRMFGLLNRSCLRSAPSASGLIRS